MFYVALVLVVVISLINHQFTCNTHLFICNYSPSESFAFQIYFFLDFDMDDFNEKGFNIYGYDHEGYDVEGFNLTGYNRIGEYDGIIDYDSSGFDPEGFNRYVALSRDFTCFGIHLSKILGYILPKG